MHIDDSQDVIVRYMQFEFLRVPHKEAVEVYASNVDVNHINVVGGGAGVGFSFAGTCDPLNGPSNGSVSDSTFTDIQVAGVWIACSSDLLIENNVFTTTPGGYGMLGIQGDAPFAGAVSGTLIRDNAFHDLEYGIEFRGILASSITNNSITNNINWGIMVRRSLKCYDPDYNEYWVCFNSTGNTITDNFVIDNGADLFHEGNPSAGTPGRAIPAGSRWGPRSRNASRPTCSSCQPSTGLNARQSGTGTLTAGSAPTRRSMPPRLPRKSGW